MKAKYYVGIAKRNKTMVIQAVKDKDYLSCELYDYMGEREVTKSYLNSKRYELLEYMKQNKPNVYGSLKFAVVE